MYAVGDRFEYMITRQNSAQLISWYRPMPADTSSRSMSSAITAAVFGAERTTRGKIKIIITVMIMITIAIMMIIVLSRNREKISDGARK